MAIPKIDQIRQDKIQQTTPEVQQNQTSESVFTVNGVPVYSSEQPADSPVDAAKVNTDTTTSAEPEVPTEELSIIEQYVKNSRFTGTIDDLLRELKHKQMTGELTQEELNIINFVENKQKQDVSVDNSLGAEDKEFANKKELEYQNILSSKNDTNYQKTFKVLDKYLSENDEKYKALSSDKDKKDYINKKIHDLLKVFKPDAKERKNGTLDLSLEDRNDGLRSIISLCISADVKGADINKITSAGVNATRIFINEYKQSKTNKIADLIGLDDKTKSSDEILHNAMELALSKDTKYQSLAGKEKEAYLKEKSVEYISKIIGLKIPVDAFDKPENAVLKDGAVALLREMHATGMNIEDFGKLSSKKQALLLKNTFQKNPQMLEKLTPNQKKNFNEYLTRLSIISELETDNPTENDIYKALLKKEKNGQLSESEQDLLNYYSNIAQRSDCQSMLNAKAGLTSFIGLACLTGKQPEEIRNMSLESVNWGKANTKDGDENLARHIRLLGTDGTIADIRTTEDHYRAWAKQQGWSDEKIDAEWVKICKIYNISRVSGFVAAHHAVRGEAVNSREAFNYGINNATSPEDKQNLQAQVTNSVQYFKTADQLFEFNDGLNDLYADSAAKGMHQYHTRETNADVVKRLSQSQNTTDAYKSTLTSSLVKYSDAADQEYYGLELSKIKDSSVTEGLAAAEQYVDSSVKSQYSKYVDNAIKNNGYSADEVKNINTARETGQTSYERNSVSSDNSKSSTADSTSSTNSKTQTANNTTANPASAQNSTSNATASYTAGASSSSVVKISQQTKPYVAELRTQLDDLAKKSAQASYEHSLAEREKTLNSLQAIIDKIQNDQQVRAQKQAELALKEAKTDEEVAQAKEKADARTEKEQQEALKNVASETIAELEQEEKLEKKYNIPIETIKELQTAQRQGDLSRLYSKLGEISADAQKHFIQYLSRKDSATILGFIRSRSSDKSLIKELCKLNPSLIKMLDPNMLLECGIAKADIIKYADFRQVSALLYELAKVGNTDELNQFYDVLGYSARNVANVPSKPVPGDDRYFAQLNKNMSSASNKVAMRYDIDKKVPRELWG